jgi:hypothetical protein
MTKLYSPEPTIYGHDTRLGVAAYIDTGEQYDRTKQTNTQNGIAIAVGAVLVTLGSSESIAMSEDRALGLIVAGKERGALDVTKFSGYNQDDEPSEESDTLRQAAARITTVTARAAELYPRVNKPKAEFTFTAQQAVVNSGLPLLPRQITQRLSCISVGFFDDTHNEHDAADFNPYTREMRLNVDTDFTESGLRQTIFHEMWHAVAGSRVTNQEDRLRGFGKYERPKDVSLDEGFVDMMAIAWANGMVINFAATGKESVAQWDRLADLYMDQKAAYLNEINAFARFFRNVDFALVAKYYLKSDFDIYEPDRLAKTHALRDMQRALKLSGGFSMPQELRELGSNLGGRSVGDKPIVVPIHSNLGHRTKRIIARNQRTYQNYRAQKIELAKRYAAANRQEQGIN